ncbi:MAG: hypothetical protein IPK63_22070 [Candidatus Competibacteraceae bacterium]|nr:hypothetical protein [Candidatus Competibacteraceae bacterium]
MNFVVPARTPAARAQRIAVSEPDSVRPVDVNRIEVPDGREGRGLTGGDQRAFGKTEDSSTRPSIGADHPAALRNHHIVINGGL